MKLLGGERVVKNSPDMEQTYKEHNVRWEWATQFIKSQDDILIAGCGYGYEIPIYRKYTMGEIWATDYSENAIEEASRDWNNIAQFRICNLENFDFNKKFDIVICFEVIEHSSIPEVVFMNLYKHLKKNGQIIFSTPASDNEQPIISSQWHKSYISKNDMLKWGMDKFNEMNFYFFQHPLFTICRMLK